MILGGIEAGGTKWKCALAEGEVVVRSRTIPTSLPEETLGQVVEFFREGPAPEALGVGSFGPIHVDPAKPEWGKFGNTPKQGWAGYDLAAQLRRELGVPIALDTDVNAAALGELRRGAAQGLDSFVYVTVGTGIGTGVIVRGQPLHGQLHPEGGHVRIPHDRERDPFPGVCPSHGDCLEGLASGTALRERWGAPAEQLADRPEVWELEASYLALGLSTLALALSPERIVIGGGVMKTPGLIELVRPGLEEQLAGYIDAPNLVAPGLGDESGVIGALELAREAV